MVYTPSFFLFKMQFVSNSSLFGSCIIHILYTEGAKIKKNNSVAKRLKGVVCVITVFYYIKFYNFVIMLVLLVHIISEMLPLLRKKLLLVVLVLSMEGNSNVLRRIYCNGNYTNFNKNFLNIFKYYEVANLLSGIHTWYKISSQNTTVVLHKILF